MILFLGFWSLYYIGGNGGYVSGLLLVVVESNGMIWLVLVYCLYFKFWV